MRYNIKRWYPDVADEGEDAELPTRLDDCERLEVVKQVIKAIDCAQNFEAIVSGPEHDSELGG